MVEKNLTTEFSLHFQSDMIGIFLCVLFTNYKYNGNGIQLVTIPYRVFHSAFYTMQIQIKLVIHHVH